MSTDALESWETLSAEWRSQHTAPAVDLAALRARARTRGRWLRVLVAAEVLVSVAMVALAALVVRERRDGTAILWASAVALALLVTWAFTMRNRRGLWHAAGERTSDYVLLTSLRARAALRTVRFTRWFVGAMWAVYALLCFTGTFAQPLARFERLLWGAGVAYSIATIAWSEWYRRRASRELDVMNELQRTLAADP